MISLGNLSNSYMIKNCPVREDSRKNKHKNDPWISKGLQNACKKKEHYIENLSNTELRKQKINIRNTKIS